MHLIGNGHEQRVREIREVEKLLDELEALSHYQIAKAIRIRSLLDGLKRPLQQIKHVEGGGESLPGGKELVGEDGNNARV